MSAINMRIPDLAVSCTPSVLGQAVPYNPVVIIEILSPSNRAETWANVWTYTSVPSVKDILILRTDIMIGDLVSRLPDGSWPDQPSRLDSDIILDSIGFRVALQDVYARTPFAPSR
jgi:Uma2 family endonuclease